MDSQVVRRTPILPQMMVVHRCSAALQWAAIILWWSYHLRHCSLRCMQRHGRRYVPLHRGRRLDGRLPLRSDGQKLTEKSLTNSW